MTAMLIRLALGTALGLVAGCAGGAIPPTYSQEELRVICERDGGWWRAGNLMAGFCEFQAPGFL